MVGKQLGDRLGNAFRYIKRYSEEIGMTPHGACLKVMAETDKVLALVIGNKECNGHVISLQCKYPVI